MPYGFPALKKDEYNLLMTWLKQGSINDTPKDLATNIEEKQIEKFENFLIIKI